MLNLAVEGEVENLAAGKLKISIDKIGVYLPDSYDFNGDQKLGVWWSGGILHKWAAAGLNYATPAYPPIAIERPSGDPGIGNDWQGYSVANGDFERYRAKFGMGGDYVNVSDIKQTLVTPPRVFLLP